MSEAPLVIELATLGIAGFDPVGVAIMPLLLAQRDGVRRAWVFLAGSASALMVTGVLGAAGLGAPIVHLNRAHPWLEHAVELVAAAVLLPLGVALLVRARRGAPESSDRSMAPQAITDRLALPAGLLFVFGYLLVTVQSLADVAFLLAMADLGSQRLGVVAVVAAVAVYAVAALAVQIGVVVAYQCLSRERRVRFTAALNGFLVRHGDRLAGFLMVALGVALALMGLYGILRPHLRS